MDFITQTPILSCQYQKQNTKNKHAENEYRVLTNECPMISFSLEEYFAFCRQHENSSSKYSESVHCNQEFISVKT